MNVVETDAAVFVEPEGNARAAVIWLHGLGADGFDFVPIVPELQLASGVPVRFVFPHAAPRPITLNGGGAMRAWYDLLGLDRRAVQDRRGIEQSAGVIEGLIGTQIASGVPRGQIILAGFSQGGAMALQVGLRQHLALAGLMALSAYLPLEATVASEMTEAGRATPLLMCHGRHDPVLALEMGTHSRDLLRALGVAIEWHDYPMAHEVCAAEIRDISAWLSARLG